MERQSARLLSTEKSLRDVQLHCQKLNSVEQKYNELYSQHQQLVSSSQKSENQLQIKLDVQLKEKKTIERQVDESNQKLEKVMQSNCALETSVKELKMKILSFDGERKEFAKMEETIKAQFALKERTINDLQRQQGEANSLLDKKNHEQSVLMTDKDNLANVNEKLALEVEEMKREIENFAQTKHEMEEMTVALQKDVASKRQEALAMIERVECLEMQLLDVKQENESLKEKTEESVRALQESTDRCNLLMSSVSRVPQEENNDASSCALTDDLNEYHMQIEQLNKEKIESSIAIDNLTNTLQQLQKELRDNERKYRVNCESAEIDLDYLNCQVEDQQKQLKQLQDKEVSFSEVKAVLEARVESQTVELDKQRQEVEAAVVAKETADIMRREIEKKLRDEKDRVTNFESDCRRKQEQKESIIFELQENVITLKQTVKHQEEVAEQAEKQFSAKELNLTTRLVESQQLNEKLASQLQSVTVDWQQLLEEKRAVEEEMHVLRDEAASLKAQSQINAKNQATVIVDLKERLGALQTAYSEKEDATRNADKEVDSFRHELEGQISDISQKYQAIETQLNTSVFHSQVLMREKCDLEKQVTELNEKLNEQEAQIAFERAEKETALNDMRECEGMLRREIQQLEKAAHETEVKLNAIQSDFESQVEEMSQKLDEQQHLIDTQDMENRETVRSNEELMFKARQLEQALTNQESHWQIEISDRDNGISDLQCRLSDAQVQHEEEIEALKEKNERTVCNLADMKRNSDELEHDINELRELLKAAVDEKKRVLEEREDMDIRLSNLNESLFSTKTDMQREREAVQLIQQEKEQLQEQISRLRNLLRQQEIENEERREASICEVANFQENIAALKQQCFELEYAKSSARAEIEGVRLELMSQIDTMTNELNSCHTQLEKAHEEMAQQQQEIEQLRQNLRELKELREEDRARQIIVNTLEERVAALDEVLADRDKTIQELGDELRHVNEVLECKCRENTEKEMELRDEVKRADEGDRDKEKLEAVFSELRVTIEEYEAKQKDCEGDKQLIDELELRVSEITEKWEMAEAARQVGEEKIQQLYDTMESQRRDMICGTNALCEKLEATESLVLEIDKVNEEMNALKQQIDIERAEHEYQREKSNKLQHEQAAKVQALEETTRETEERIFSTQADLEAQLNKASEQLAKRDDEAVLYKETISKLQDQAERLQQTLNEQEISLQEASLNQQNLAAQLSVLSAEASFLKAEQETSLAAKETVEKEVQQIALKCRDDMAESKRKAGIQIESIFKLEEHVKSLEAELSHRKAEARELALAREQLESQVSQLSHEVSSVRHDLNETQTALQLKKDEVARLDVHLSESLGQSTKKAESQEQTIARLKESLADAQHAYCKLQTSMQTNQVPQLEDKIEKLNRENWNLREEAETAIFTKDEVLAENEHMKETIAELKKQLIAIETEVNESSDKVTKAVDEKNRFELEMKKLRVKLAAQEEELMAKVESLNDLVDLKLQLSCLESVLKEKEDLLGQVESQKVDFQIKLEKQLHEANARCDELSACVTAKDIAVQDAVQLAESLERQANQHKRECEKEKNEQEKIISDLRKRLTCLQQAHSEQEDAIEHAAREFASVRSEFELKVKQLLTEVATAKEEIKVISAERSTTEVKVREFSDQYDELCAHVLTKETAAREAEERAEKLKDELCKMEAEQQARKEQDRISADLCERIHVWEMTCSEQKTAMETATKEYTSMKSILEVNIKKLTRDVDELTVELKKTAVAKNEAVQEKEALQTTVEKLKSKLNLLEKKLLTGQEKFEPLDVDIPEVNGINKERLSSSFDTKFKNSSFSLLTPKRLLGKSPTHVKTPVMEASTRRRYQLRSSNQTEANRPQLALPQRILPNKSKSHEREVSNASEGDCGKSLHRTKEKGKRMEKKSVHWKDELRENSPSLLQEIKFISPDSPTSSPLKQWNHPASSGICPESPLVASFDESTDQLTPGKSPGKRTLYSKARRDASALPSQPSKRTKVTNSSKLRPTRTTAAIIDVRERPECKTQ